MNKAYLRISGEKQFSLLHRKRHFKNPIISLLELKNIYKSEGESFSGIQDIRVDQIVGSEDRSSDFAEGFIPTKSWMENRWTKVWALMEEGILEEPIDVFNYGGLYFVRDGNHRVSVAKSMKRDFIRAKVTTLNVPFKLHNNLCHKNLHLFKKLVNFHVKSNFFTYVPDAYFDIKRASSWDILEKEILCWNPAWFDRHKLDYEELSPNTQCNIWYEHLNKIIFAHIKKRSLHYLFPGWGDSDVAMEIIELWNTYNNPDDVSIEELYQLFIKRTRKRRFLLTPIHFIVAKINHILRTPTQERELFLESSGIEYIRPDFRLPSDLGKKYWRKLYSDLFNTHYYKLKKELGRPPYHYELVSDWYDNVWLPRTTT